MAWPSTLRLLVPFMAAGLAGGLLFGAATGHLLYYSGMGFAAGSMMGAAWVVRTRRAAQASED